MNLTLIIHKQNCRGARFDFSCFPIFFSINLNSTNKAQSRLEQKITIKKYVNLYLCNADAVNVQVQGQGVCKTH